MQPPSPHRRAPRSVALWLIGALAIAVVTSGCASDEAHGVLIDPDAFGTDQGTLIGIADLRVVADEMLNSMNASERISALRQTGSPLTVIVGNFKQRTSIAVFDKQVFVNGMLSNLSRADQDGAYSFLRRDTVQEERQLQASSIVTGGTPATMQGADYVLSGEVRELLTRTAQESGTEVERRAIQYTLTLTDVASGILVWSHSHDIVKQQVIGAVYR